MLSQQCGPTPALAAGAFQEYRAVPASTPCDVPPSYTSPDTNATALAIQALQATALGAPNVAAALDRLATQQTTDGGFGYQFSPDPDPNSTSLVIQGIVAGGENPSAGRWNDAGHTPYTSLLTWQLGCDAAATDRGGFASPYSDGFADNLATVQAVWGVGGKPFPITAAVTFGPASDPCAPPATTSTSTSVPPTTVTTTSSTTTTSTVGVSEAAATPVNVTPVLAG